MSLQTHFVKDSSESISFEDKQNKLENFKEMIFFKETQKF